MEKLTLKDIADRAGVSMMTVSNVINGKSSRVSAQTAEKINDIIKESGYVPNLTARSLTKKSSAIVGVIISVDDQNENYLENPYVSTMIGIIEKELPIRLCKLALLENKGKQKGQKTKVKFTIDEQTGKKVRISKKTNSQIGNSK